jgi:hypothetical protein
MLQSFDALLQGTVFGARDKRASGEHSVDVVYEATDQIAVLGLSAREQGVEDLFRLLRSELAAADELVEEVDELLPGEGHRAEAGEKCLA